MSLHFPWLESWVQWLLKTSYDLQWWGPHAQLPPELNYPTQFSCSVMSDSLWPHESQQLIPFNLKKSLLGNIHTPVLSFQLLFSTLFTSECVSLWVFLILFLIEWQHEGHVNTLYYFFVLLLILNFKNVYILPPQRCKCDMISLLSNVFHIGLLVYYFMSSAKLCLRPSM